MSTSARNGKHCTSACCAWNVGSDVRRTVRGRACKICELVQAENRQLKGELSDLKLLLRVLQANASAQVQHGPAVYNLPGLQTSSAGGAIDAPPLPPDDSVQGWDGYDGNAAAWWTPPPASAAIFPSASMESATTSFGLGSETGAIKAGVPPQEAGCAYDPLLHPTPPLFTGGYAIRGETHFSG
ncbi:hypothetical protein AURDEDRAFT_164910 [Auricularia subglabra TFB-10046 SS5]|nr:hypothetical protein AURDEDRAFT_164910 [Auricularia subglabra TFB-10046 SS5]